VNSALLPGSSFLQACFYLLAAAILWLANQALWRASLACGDSIKVTRRRVRRYQLYAVVWLTLVSGAAFSGLLYPRDGPPLPFALMMISVLIHGLVLARSEAGNCLARGLPLAYLVGFQGFRFPLELAMHRAHTEGLMPVQMSYSGLNFDIVTGITAVLLSGAMAYMTVPKWVVYAWSIVGLGLLANILVVATLSTPVFAYFGPDRLNVWIMRMPYTLLPAVMVLAAWAGQLIVLGALSLPTASRPDPR
jgi:hypothetical protein